MNEYIDNKIIISIIMPNYNGAKYLQKSIESVINQTNADWELIIVDDYSTDESVSIINGKVEKDERIKLHILNENSGTPGVPRNKGLDTAKGDYIAFLDSDDIWHPQKLAIQLKFMLKHNSKFSFTNVLPFSNDSEIKPYLLENFTIDEDLENKSVSYNYLLRKNFVKSCSTAIVKRDTIGEIRFNDDPTFKAVEDYMFWLFLLKKNCKLAYWLDLNTTFYRESVSSISSSKWFMIKQNYKKSNYLFNEEKRRKKMVFEKMLSYGFYSIKYIINQKINRK